MAAEKILTIKIDQIENAPLQITYKIGDQEEVNTALTGIKITDTAIINKIFSTFLKDSKLMKEYTAAANLFEPLDEAKRWRDFNDFVPVLKAMPPQNRIIFNTKALTAVFDYIKSTNTPTVSATSYFTSEAIKITRTYLDTLNQSDNTQISKVLNAVSDSRKKVVGLYSTEIIAAVTNHLELKPNEYNNPTLLSTYLNVKYWVTQFYAWYKEFNSNSEFITNTDKKLSKPAFYKNIDFRAGGKKTQKNNKVYSHEI